MHLEFTTHSQNENKDSIAKIANKRGRHYMDVQDYFTVVEELSQKSSALSRTLPVAYGHLHCNSGAGDSHRTHYVIPDIATSYQSVPSNPTDVLLLAMGTLLRVVPRCTGSAQCFARKGGRDRLAAKPEGLATTSAAQAGTSRCPCGRHPRSWTAPTDWPPPCKGIRHRL